jgi:hypothetical protein
MIFNLQTYRGKYGNDKNIRYLTGNIETDSQNLLSILGINQTLDYLEK